MAESQYLKSNLKYYSFKIGSSIDKPNNWTLYDWKIPAVDERMAISMFFMSFQFIQATRSRNYFLRAKQYQMPSKKWANGYIRQIIEYEREYTPKKGYTQHVYKRRNIYNPQHFLRLLKDKY